MPPVTPLKQSTEHHERRVFGTVKSSNKKATAVVQSLMQRTPIKPLEPQQIQPQPHTKPTNYLKDATIVVLPANSRKRRLKDDEHLDLGPAQESDIVKNGRALFAATTTALGAPAEISSKRIRRSPFDHNNTPQIPTTNSVAASASANLPATPRKAPIHANLIQPNSRPLQRTSVLPTSKTISKPTTSKRLSSNSKKRATNAHQRTSKAVRDEEKRAAQEQAALEWKRSYKKGFKTFVFYFDSIEDSMKKDLSKCVRELDARVETFFSKAVTHVVTTRSIPPVPQGSSAVTQSAIIAPTNDEIAAESKENENEAAPVQRNSSESPVKNAAINILNRHQQYISNTQDASSGSTRKTTGTKSVGKSTNTNYHPMRTPPKQTKPYHDMDKPDSRDILVKAVQFGIKVWSVEKMQRVVDRLLDVHSPSKALINQNFNTGIGNISVQTTTAFQMQLNGGAMPPNNSLIQSTTTAASNASTKPKLSLPSLLRAEALTGSTYERDLSTLRPDYHYFNPKNGYLLVEDSSGMYAPCHAKEYDQRIYPRANESENRDTEWPTLWGGQEGRGAFYKASTYYQPTGPNPYLRAINNAADPERPPYELTKYGTHRPTKYLSEYSHMLKRSASMTAIHSLPEQQPLQPIHIPNGNKQAGDSYQVASGNSQTITSNIASATSATTTRSGQVIGAGGAAGNANSLATGVIVDKRLARLGSKAKRHIVTVGGKTNNNSNNNENLPPVAASNSTATLAPPPRFPSPATSVTSTAPTRPPVEQAKKPGYCENCRVRYENFKAHTKSKKHRRFALDLSNWYELDGLLSRISRPVNSQLLQLYDAAGCEVPSDIEASDDDESDSDHEMSEEVDELSMRDAGYYKLVLKVDGSPVGTCEIQEQMKNKRTGEEAGLLDKKACHPILDTISSFSEGSESESHWALVGQCINGVGSDDSDDSDQEMDGGSVCDETDSDCESTHSSISSSERN